MPRSACALPESGLASLDSTHPVCIMTHNRLCSDCGDEFAMAKSFRMNISIPMDLKERMDAVDEPVNWSAMACQAFQAKLAEINAKRKVAGMEDVIARLRASKRSQPSEVYRGGHEAGRKWARADAEAIELKRLNTFQDECRGDAWHRFFDSEAASSAFSPAELLVFVIQPENEADRRAAADFWEAVTGEKRSALATRDEYIKGFAEGALELWDEVKNHI
jgi:hypothetical protein